MRGLISSAPLSMWSSVNSASSEERTTMPTVRNTTRPAGQSTYWFLPSPCLRKPRLLPRRRNKDRARVEDLRRSPWILRSESGGGKQVLDAGRAIMSVKRFKNRAFPAWKRERRPPQVASLLKSFDLQDLETRGPEAPKSRSGWTLLEHGTTVQRICRLLSFSRPLEGPAPRQLQRGLQGRRPAPLGPPRGLARRTARAGERGHP